MNSNFRKPAILYLMAALIAPAVLAQSPELTSLRQEIEATRAQFETRMAELETRIEQLQAAEQTPSPRVATERLDAIEGRLQQVELGAAQSSAPASPSAFNPQMSVILSGSYADLSQDPDDYRLQGFIPGGEGPGPGDRGFSLGESEMTLSANIDPLFYGQATFAVSGDNEIGTEEAFVRTTALPDGLTAQIGRAFSAVGYVNGQHAHAWDFVDLPLANQALLGGQYRNDGIQIKWLAPLDTFVELGAELGSGEQFPGSDQHDNGIGSYTLFASAGNDIGYSASWKAGLAWLGVDAEDRAYEEADALLPERTNPTRFSGDSELWNAYLVYKWAPNGNSRERNFKFQTEYFDRDEDGVLAQDNLTLGSGSAAYHSQQSGWYAQGIYQFRPNWRFGLRYDRLDSGSVALRVNSGHLGRADFPLLAGYDPDKATLMLDYSPSEFSRMRLQYAHDQSAPGSTENEVYLQYLMSLGAHGAHQF